MLWALLKYIEQHSLQEKFKDIWTYIEDDYDGIITQVWEKDSIKGSIRKTWLQSNRFAVRPFLDVAAAKGVDEKLATGAKVAPDALLSICVSQLGCSLFASEGQDLQFDQYSDFVQKAVHDAWNILP